MKNIWIYLVVLCCSSTVFAHDGNGGWVTAQDYHLWSSTYTNPQIRLQVNDGYYNPAGAVCTSLDSYMIGTDLTQDMQNRMYSTLLAALMAQKSVRLRLDTTSCQDSRPKIITVVIN